MDILIFTKKYPKSFREPIVSGLVKNPFYLSLALRELGHNVGIITFGRQEGTWYFDGIEVSCAGRGPLKGTAGLFFLDIKMTLLYLELAKKRKFDIIHIHSGNLAAFFLLRQAGLVKTPVIYSAHGTSTPELRANMRKEASLKNLLLLANGKIQERVDAFMWRRSDRTLTSSRYQIKEMREIYGVPAEKTECIHNGADGSRYFPDAEAGKILRRKLNIPSTAPLILYVGRAARKKGIHFLVDSVKHVTDRMPSARFLFVIGDSEGQKEYRNEIFKMVERKGQRKHIIILEGVEEERLPACYNAADICVFPSTGYESVPTVVYEAMACGKPVITQGSWGSVEVLDGIFVSEEDLKKGALADAVMRTLKDGRLRSETARKNIKRAKDFYWESIARRHIALYERVIASAE